jgi:phospholipase/carboxylesterase
MASTLEGPAIEPAAGGPARQLVVLLHGYGADGNDLIALGREWAHALPHAAFVAPNAPEPCADAGFGYQWFRLTFRDPHECVRGVRQAAPRLDAYLDAELRRRGLGDSALALVGFSQGTMLALHVAPRRKAAPACVVGFSGHLADAQALKAEARVRPPVLLVHGDRDDVIPVQALPLAVQGLAAAEIPVEWHIIEGLGHGIDPRGLALAGNFLRRALVDG